MALEKRAGGAGNRERREQILLLQLAAAEQQHVRGNAEDARDVFGALHLAAHPVDPVGDA